MRYRAITASGTAPANSSFTKRCCTACDQPSSLVVRRVSVKRSGMTSVPVEPFDCQDSGSTRAFSRVRISADLAYKGVLGPEWPYPQLHHCSRRRSRPGFPAATPHLGKCLLSWTWMEHSKKHKGAGRKFIDQGRHRHGARHRGGRGQRRRAPAGGGGGGASGRVIKTRMAFLEEKGCVSWDISAAPRRSGREYYGNEPK